MRIVTIPIILIGYIITIVTCISSHAAEPLAVDSPTDTDYDDIFKRSGLDRRAYTYTAGFPGTKRLPTYNFGLGKRSNDWRNLDTSEGKRNTPQRYNFGMGKRADSDGQLSAYFDDGKRENLVPSPLYFDLNKQEEDSSPLEFGILKRQEDYRSDKRARPYSFGLGKRYVMAYDGIERRSVPVRYNFGLGR